MNYSEMSDDEINLKVLEQQFGPLGDDKDIVRIWQQGKFQPCNSWADAGPVIVSNLISLRPVSLFVGGCRWFASLGEGDFGIKAADNNPLRAAMIVFLKSQEKK